MLARRARGLGFENAPNNSQSPAIKLGHKDILFTKADIMSVSKGDQG